MKIITIAEASELSGKSQKTIRRAVASGSLLSTKIQNKFDEKYKVGLQCI